MKVLIVEDDKLTVSFIAKGMEKHGFACEKAYDGQTGLKLLSENAYDISIVDIKLPKISGLELIKKLRKAKINTPIIVLSALKLPSDRINGLKAGADDYLAKPFALNELTARIDAILRRTTNIELTKVLSVGNLMLNVVTRQVTRGGREISLTPIEYTMLEYLMKNVNRTLSAEQIFMNVWNGNTMPTTTVVETRLCLIRKKLCEAGESDMIHTVRGFGYVLR